MISLWNGADVRWVGPIARHGGVELQPGAHAVVVDAGRHHIRSFTSLARSSRAAGHGGVIVLVGDQQVEVPAHHLELVAPEHPLRPYGDPSVADWWLEQLEGWGRILPVAAFVPRTLPAVCRVLHPWNDQTAHDVTWQQAAQVAGLDSRAALARQLVASQYSNAPRPQVGQLDEPSQGELDENTAASLIDVLAPATTTPDEVFVAVWVGWGDTPAQRFPGAAHLATPKRGHFLLRGPLAGAMTSVSAFPVRTQPVSGIWWPADRAWMVHTEIDFHWTYLAGTQQLVDNVLARRDLEAMAVTHDSPANELTDGPRATSE